MLSVGLKHWLPLCLFVLLIVQMCYSITLAVIVLVRHQNNIKLINADINAINLNWLKYLLYIVSSILILWYAGIFFSFNWIEQYRPIVVLGMVLCLGYYVIAQKEIYPFEVSKLREIDELFIAEQEQINTPRLTTEIMSVYKTRLLQIMETERVYLQHDITLPQLASMMEVSSHDLSYVINNGFNMTFFTFINSYRIAEAKKLLISEDLKHFNIIGIAYNSGFNSKSTFNSAFKKETGLSPTQFINKSKQGLITPVHS
ncbi:AraC family transcriptional regulator [Mucilaginibacter sp. CAU 1740]|uniref:helix-turn-helix domain-containing protein n=1 Tax=Mucilaginibacter sp. CAU 1740 TaxID=3140365 RepID=UPI00325B40E8